MLEKEYRYLDRNITNLKKSCVFIKKKLDAILQMPDRCFKVNFNNKEYTFFYPSTMEEKDQLAAMREELITDILKDCICSSLDNLHASNENGSWDIVFAFVMGHPEEYYQIEKINVTHDSYDVVDAQGNMIKSIPLNEDNYHVKIQIQDKK